MTPTYDPVWDEHYAGGAGCRYPWDSVVTFVFRHRPQDKQANDTKLLEVGCGLGSNLQFAATEGFQVSGLDASDDAIRRATSIFKQEGLSANLKVGNFTSLPFENKAFDMVIDRAALTCCGQSALALAIEEIYRVLKPGGKFFFTPYSQDHTSYRAGSAGDDGVVININGGSLVGVGQICFASKNSVEVLFNDAKKWRIESMMHIVKTDVVANNDQHAEWHIVVQRL